MPVTGSNQDRDRRAARTPWSLLAVLAATLPSCGTGDPYSPRSLERLRDEVLPDVERASGLRFKRAVPVLPVSGQDLLTASREEMSRRVEVVFASEPADVRESIIEHWIQGREEARGKYCPSRAHVLIVPDSCRQGAARDLLPPADEERALALVLSHELTHALQHQHFESLDVYGRLEGPEQNQVLSLLEEGHAQFVEAEVARRRGWSRLHAGMRVRPPLAPVPPGDPEAAINSAHAAVQMGMLYDEGEAFVRAFIRERGLPDLAALFRDPPRRTRAVLHPDLGPGGLPEVDFSPMLAPLVERARAGGWTLASGPVNELFTRGWYAALVPPPRVRQAFRDFRDGGWVQLNRGWERIQATAMLAASPAAATRLALLARAHMRAQNRLYDERRPGAFRVEGEATLAVTGWDEAVLVEYTLPPPGSDQRRPKAMAFARAGRTFLEIALIGPELGGEDLRATLRAMAAGAPR